VYADKEGGLWIIPTDKKPYKFNRDLQTFEALPGINDASAIFQDSDKEYWIGTYSTGLYHLNRDRDYKTGY